MSYAYEFENGAKIEGLVEAARNTIFVSHAGEGLGRINLGMLPGGKSLVYKQGFSSEESTLEVLENGEFSPLVDAEPRDAYEAFKVLDRKFARYGVV